ncbi:MAG: hypothetical protein DPW09_15630 [Anaerolineae bacterium]|nr:hypothetical protein [Anaerolineae bacterium]
MPPPPIHLSVPHVQQQWPGECLVACSQMVLTYLAIPVTYKRLLRLLRVKSDAGTLAANIRHLEQLNLEVIYQHCGFDELYHTTTCGKAVPTLPLSKQASYPIGMKSLTTWWSW